MLEPGWHGPSDRKGHPEKGLQDYGVRTGRPDASRLLLLISSGYLRDLHGIPILLKDIVVTVDKMDITGLTTPFHFLTSD